MTEWEYKLEKLVANCGPSGNAFGIQRPPDTYKQIQERLNELGAGGWELVSVGPPTPSDCDLGTVLGVYYFKRPKAVVGAPVPGK